LDLVEVTDGNESRYICYLFIRETKTGTPREVPCWSRTSTRLLHWKAFQDTYCEKHHIPRYGRNDYVFGKPEADKLPHSSASYYNMWRKTIDALKERLIGNRFSDKPYTIYSLRSTFIENHLSRGVDAYLVARVSGHDIKTMSRYYERSDVRSRSCELTILDLPDEKQKQVPIFNGDARRMKDQLKVSTNLPADKQPVAYTGSAKSEARQEER